MLNFVLPLAWKERELSISALYYLVSAPGKISGNGSRPGRGAGRRRAAVRAASAHPFAACTTRSMEPRTALSRAGPKPASASQAAISANE